MQALTRRRLALGQRPAGPAGDADMKVWNALEHQATPPHAGARATRGANRSPRVAAGPDVRTASEDIAAAGAPRPASRLLLGWQVSWLADRGLPACLPGAEGPSGVPTGGSPLTVAGAAAAFHRVPFSSSGWKNHPPCPIRAAAHPVKGAEPVPTHPGPWRRALRQEPICGGSARRTRRCADLYRDRAGVRRRDARADRGASGGAGGGGLAHAGRTAGSCRRPGWRAGDPRWWIA